MIEPAQPLIEQLASNGFSVGDQVFLRIYKSRDGTSTDTGRIEAFIQPSDSNEYQFFKSWDICKWSGTIGPKHAEGDKQSPEGFYGITAEQLNPNSKHHLSFNLGFPNEYDRYHGRTGTYLMVHGGCSSVGCYAIGDENVEEAYALAEQALAAGQKLVPVHAFPFPLYDEILSAHKNDPNFDFWQNLKIGHDIFEKTKTPPEIIVDNGRYNFN